MDPFNCLTRQKLNNHLTKKEQLLTCPKASELLEAALTMEPKSLPQVQHLFSSYLSPPWEPEGLFSVVFASFALRTSSSSC
jgi:hypothetical protein